MNRVFAIGDVQGCLDELRALLDKIDYQEGDQLWFAGDLINRGPKSLETLRFIKSLPNTIITLGNHDLSLLAHAYRGLPSKEGDTIDEILEANDRDELLHWLRQQKLFHFDAELKTAMVHASVPPKWSIKTCLKRAKQLEAVLRSDKKLSRFLKKMYGNQPNQWSKGLKKSARLRYITNAFTRARYYSNNGELELKSKGAPYVSHQDNIPWFHLNGRKARRTRIVFGHWSTLGLSISNNCVCLDTGCVWQGHLTAMRLDTPTPEFFQVKSLHGIRPL